MFLSAVPLQSRATSLHPARERLVFSLPNNQRQHRTLHVQKDVLPLRIVLLTVPRFSRYSEPAQGVHRCEPLSSEYGTHKIVEAAYTTVKATYKIVEAIFWP